ncbi:MAG: DNA-3-methyladenine glycosylase family protein [Acidiferrobacter sp.]
MPSRQTTIAVPVAYDFGAALAFLRESPSAVLESVDGHTYRRAWQAGRACELVSVEQVVAGLRVRVEGPRVDAKSLAEAVRKVRHIFSLDVEAGAFQELVATDPILARLVGDDRHARPVLIADPFESLVWAIIGQQVGVGFARSLRQALVHVVGREATFGAARFGIMPEAQALAGVDEEVLRALHFSRAKIRTLRIAAQATVEGALDFASFAALPGDQALAALTRFSGIGPWTAEMVLMRGLGLRSVWPAADLGLRRALAHAQDHGAPVSEACARALALPWSGWEAWVAYFAWRSLTRSARDP